MGVLVVIPARFASARYLRKPLVDLRGATREAKSLIHRSWDAAMAVTGVDRVVIATDDDRIKDAAEAFGADVINLVVGHLYRPSSRLRRRLCCIFRFGQVLKTPWRNGLRNLMMLHRLTCCLGSLKRHCVDWKRSHVGHRSFTVIRHPVARAHAAFCDKILPTGEGSYVGIRKMLSQQFKLNLPSKMPDGGYSDADHKQAFLGFLKFVKSNLGGQTAVRVDSHWATQATALQGFADFVTPDMVLREDRLGDDLGILAATVGKNTMPLLAEQTDPYADRLMSIYDADIEAAVLDVYQRDYDAFGFGAYA